MLLLLDMTVDNHMNFLHLLKRYLQSAKVDFKCITDTSEICTIDYKKVNGIIISGSSSSLTQPDTKTLNLLRNAIYPLIITKVPTLGICFGMQILNYLFGGTLVKMKEMENTVKEIEITKTNSPLFKRAKETTKKLKVCLRHTDKVKQLCPFYEVIAKDSNNNVMAICNKKHAFYGVQFHPEAIEETHFIIKNFLGICKM